MLRLSKPKAKQSYGCAILRLSNSNASVIQGLIAQKGLKAASRLYFLGNLKRRRAHLVAIGAQKDLKEQNGP